MTQVPTFTGFTNTDDPDDDMPPGHHREAYNIEWKGSNQFMRGQNTPGTRMLINGFMPSVGQNLCVGRYYDSINNRIFFFNYRADGQSAVYMFNTVSEVFSRVIQEGVNASVGALGLTTSTVSNINIIHGDSVQGDILFYLDGAGTPRKINIARALSGGYGSIISSFLDVAKEPADIPPYVVYENDADVSINNLRKKLFRFKIRWVFDDQDKAVTSSQSEMPVPYNAFDQATDTNPTMNCRIAVVYQTGPANVKKVEILAANSIGNTMSDFYLVASLDKDELALPDNDIATFLFYNDKGYVNIDVRESILTYDRVPQIARAQTVINGDVLDYGNITEGYPNQLDLVATSERDVAIWYAGNFFINLIANQSGQAAFGSGAIHIVVRGTSAALNANFRVIMTDSTDVSYAVQVGDDDGDIINGLRTNALSKGYTVLSVGFNDLYIIKTGIVLERTMIVSDYSNNTNLNTSFPVWDWSSRYGLGLVYFDQKGRTNGVVYTDELSVQTQGYTETIPPTDRPVLFGSIFSQPPVWAYYFQWVVTKNLSKQTFVQWISDRTFKDVVAVSGLVKYAYISIESLNAFVTQNSGSPLGYSFTPGDRIYFFKRFNGDGTTANDYVNGRNYEIVGSENNPTVNGDIRTGQFVKIILPETDGNFDFGVPGYDNYFIELYTPAQPVANNLNVYYEFGQRYQIGLPGQSGRYHQGGVVQQIVGSVGGRYEFLTGDDYIRKRSIQTGNVYSFSVLSGGTGNNIDTILIGLNFNGSTYAQPGITAISVPYVPLTGSFNPGADSRHFLAATPNTTFRVKGSMVMTFTNASAGDSWRVYHENRFGEQSEVVGTFDASGASSHTFTIDLSITLENDWIFLIAASNTSTARTVTFSATSLTYTIDHVISQVCIDRNFSDYYESEVNSYGRPFAYDENSDTVTYPTMYRWSLAYQPDTNINQTCRFYPENFDVLSRDYGPIRRMMVWDKVKTVFQARKCSQVGVYNKFITQADGSQQLITSTDIITQNNAQPYAGDFGVGDQVDSVVQSDFVYYFPDPNKGAILRLSRDGITNLSEIYKNLAGSNVIKDYLSDHVYPYGGISRITGTFQLREDNVGQYLCVLQSGTSGTGNVIGQTQAFEEARNAFSSKYSFAPDCIICAETSLYSWSGGEMYIHDNTSGGMNTFYGVYYDPYVVKVFNASLIEKKNWLSLSEIASSVWDCPSITTNYKSYPGQTQQSNLITQDFEDSESTFTASFLGDLNSIDGLYGDTLKGNIMTIKFRAPNATSLVWISAVNIYSTDSPLTNR